MKQCMHNYKEMLETIHNNLNKFGEKTPKQLQGFHKFLMSVEGKGRVSQKYKELIALGCAVVTHCDWCIAYHVNGALEAGATEEEILEATWVAVLMGGGPALMYAQGVLKALEDFKKKK